MPARPTWAQVQTFAAKLNQSGKTAGICLRGLAGWGDNMASLDTVVNTFGGEWFNMSWQPQLTSPAFESATSFYVNLVDGTHPTHPTPEPGAPRGHPVRRYSPVREPGSRGRPADRRRDRRD
jgi:sorbitol/mannitol transport system substrate-binding protein